MSFMSLHNFLNIWNIVTLTFICLLILIFVLVPGQFLLMDFFFFLLNMGEIFMLPWNPGNLWLDDNHCWVLDIFVLL